MNLVQKGATKNTKKTHKINHQYSGKPPHQTIPANERQKTIFGTCNANSRRKMKCNTVVIR
jgi:hypothetical protein